jgi:hypothetical protein
MSSLPIPFEIQAQPNDVTCGPTCMHAVYKHFGSTVPFDSVLESVPMLELGGTLAVHLGNDALARGYTAKLLTWNIQVFDPIWFLLTPEAMAERMAMRAALRPAKAETYTAYLEFLKSGGKIELVDLTPDLLRRNLRRGVPILTGLSSTFLYRNVRERLDDLQDDDVDGEPTGHFVVVTGYDPQTRQAQVADPLFPNPMAAEHIYSVPMARLVGAIFLGVLTHDANLLIVEPRRANTGRR